MVKSTVFVALSLFGHAFAFPSYGQGMFDSLAGRAVEEAAISAPVKRQTAVGFDPAYQYVSNQGVHKFIAPNFKKGDQRGPCPGLNAMANHGYIPRNGVASIEQLTLGCYQAFGMGLDLANFLATYGAIVLGNSTAFSIGGPTSLLGLPVNFIGTPGGLSGSHNKYENDASPMRGDLYLYNESYLTHVKNFNLLYNMQKGVPDKKVNYNLTLLTQFRIQRYENSVQTNPYFWSGLFSGAIAVNAAYSFIFRLMANKSAEYPEGRLDRNTLKSFYSITGNPNNFTYTPGYEKIPNNWYKRALGDEYSIPLLAPDALAMVLTYPHFASVGGNLGQTNTFTGFDLGNLTGGVYNFQNILYGNNLTCFGFEFGLDQVPDLLEGLYFNVVPVQNTLTQAFANATSQLGGCPQIEDKKYGQFAQYPGYSQSYDGYIGMN